MLLFQHVCLFAGQLTIFGYLFGVYQDYRASLFDDESKFRLDSTILFSGLEDEDEKPPSGTELITTKAYFSRKEVGRSPSDVNSYRRNMESAAGISEII